MPHRFRPGTSASTLIVSAAALYLFAAAVMAAQAPGPKPSVWDGVFTADQAGRGRIAFAQHCASCHGGELKGGEGKPLAGDPFWTDWRETTVEYLLTRISTEMPFSEDGRLAGTLSPSVYADVVSYILQQNGLPAGTRELTRASSAGVQIIRKDGPGELPASTLARVVGCLSPRGANKEYTVTQAAAPVRVTDGAPAPDPAAPLGQRQFALKFVLQSLDKFVGQRVSVTGLLIGEGGANGINLSAITPVAPTCN
jgi:mono/diheme cytochrome c family protein